LNFVEKTAFPRGILARRPVENGCRLKSRGLPEFKRNKLEAEALFPEILETKRT